MEIKPVEPRRGASRLTSPGTVARPHQPTGEHITAMALLVALGKR